MTRHAPPSLIEVINKIKTIAELEFENRLCDNILTIFNRLHVKEKRMLLKGLINICFVIDNKISLDLVPDKADTKIAAGSVEEFNKIELIKLKTWLVKATTIAFSVVVIGFTLITLNINESNEHTLIMLDEFFKILKVILTT